jgi:hypothetical protein
MIIPFKGTSNVILDHKIGKIMSLYGNNQVPIPFSLAKGLFFFFFFFFVLNLSTSKYFLFPPASSYDVLQ